MIPAKDIKFKRELTLVASVLLIVGVLLYLESSKVDTGSATIGNQDIVVESIIKESDVSKELGTEARLSAKRLAFEPAKEISTPDGFINTEGINISELIGKKIILVDFWTYSCINCQRTIPFLNAWHTKYEDDGLIILGLHTPEFEFEKEYDNVLRATEKWNIKYPVILDNDYSTWRSYQNRYWPRKYLIDIDGFIVYDHIGEGGYEETEKKIVELLNEKNKIIGEEMVMLDTTKPEGVDVVDFGRVGSPETYLGSSRLKLLANLPSKDCFGKICDFEALEPHTLNTFQLSGSWNIGEENAVLVNGSGSIFYRFNASKVNLVAGNKTGVKASIYLDGEKIKEVVFKDSDLYNLVDLGGSYEEHLLEIRFVDPGVEAFAFTFG